MAIFRPGPFFTAIRGSVGPLAFRTALVGGNVQQRTRRSPKRNEAQRQASRRLRAVHELWASLTDAERVQWEAFAAATPLLPPPDGEPFRDGRGTFIAGNTRLLAAERLPTLLPGAPPFFTADPPWLKVLPLATPGVATVWWEPSNADGSPIDTVWMLSAGRPRPGTRKAYRRDEAHFHSILKADAAQQPGVLELDFRSRGTFRPGSRLNLRTAAVATAGDASRSYGWDVRWPSDRETAAFAAWNFFSLANTYAIELTPRYVARVWPGNFPDGPPDEADLVHPTLRDVRYFRDFCFNRFPFDTWTYSSTALNRPATDLSPFPVTRLGAKSGVRLFTVPP